MSSFPQYRPRRLRRTAALRNLVRETHLAPAQLVLPVPAVLLVLPVPPDLPVQLAQLVPQVPPMLSIHHGQFLQHPTGLILPL